MSPLPPTFFLLALIYSVFFYFCLFLEAFLPSTHTWKGPSSCSEGGKEITGWVLCLHWLPHSSWWVRCSSSSSCQLALPATSAERLKNRYGTSFRLTVPQLCAETLGIPLVGVSLEISIVCSTHWVNENYIFNTRFWIWASSPGWLVSKTGLQNASGNGHIWNRLCFITFRQQNLLTACWYLCKSRTPDSTVILPVPGILLHLVR